MVATYTMRLLIAALCAALLTVHIVPVARGADPTEAEGVSSETAEDPAAKGTAGDPNPESSPQVLPQEPAAELDQPALLEQGWHALRLANYPKALRLFDEAIAAATDPDIEAQAAYAKGVLWQTRKPGANVNEAKKLYEQVVEEYGETEAMPFALMGLARLADLPPSEDDRDEAQARKLYRRIRKGWPDHFLAAEATIHLAQSYLVKHGEPGERKKGADILQKYIEEHPDAPFAVVRHMMLGGYYNDVDEYAKAVEHWIAADEAGIPGLNDKAGTYFKIANRAETKLKDYPLAVKYYEKIVYDVRRTTKYYISKLAAERCRRKAREAGQEVPKHPNAPAPGEVSP